MAYRRLLQSECGFQKIIDEGTDEEMLICGYEKSIFKRILLSFLTIVTLGFIQLIMRWKPTWKITFTCVPVEIDHATVLLLKDIHHQSYVVEVQNISCNKGSDVEMLNKSGSENDLTNSSENLNQPSQNVHDYRRFFIHKLMKYVWDPRIMCFKRLRAYDVDTPCSDFYEKFHGLKLEEYHQKLNLYGKNIIDIQVKSYWTLLIEEVLNPFYIFQVASIILWVFDDYYYYAACIFIVSFVSICISLFETKKQIRTLRDMVSTSNSVRVNVFRQGNEMVEIPSSDLVPGDVLIIPAVGCLMACDAVLIAGNCIVNESMLTGESVPETKTPLTAHTEEELYDPSQHKRHTLFCGTHVIQTRYYGHNIVKAVVVRTGFSTAKGELVRSILFPKPMSFKFYKDSIKFVLMLFFLSVLGMGYSIYLYIERGATVLTILVRALDVITIVVPPALPAALTVGVIYAQTRLKKKGIFCVSPPKINVAGKLKLMCFDKTGTLTEEGLDLWGIVPVDNNSFQRVLHHATELDERCPLIAAMATCHSLTTINGKLAGDPLDEKMFIATNWVLHESRAETEQFDALEPTTVKPLSSTFEASGQDEFAYEIGIVRQFPFSSNLQRMSVICRTLGSTNMDLYVKGAPEKIVTLCQGSLA